MQLFVVLCSALIFLDPAWASTPEDPDQSPSIRTKRFWNLLSESPNYAPEQQALNPVKRPIGWLIPPDYSPSTQRPTRRRPTTTRPTHGGLTYEIVKGVVLAGASNVVRVLSQTTPRPFRLATTRPSQLKRRIRPSKTTATTTTTTEVPLQSSSVASAFLNPADGNNVLVPVTTYGQDGKPTIVYMFVSKDRILGYRKGGVESSTVEALNE